MKRAVKLLLVALIIFSCSACSRNSNDNSDNGTVSVTSESKIDLSKYDISNDIYDDVFSAVDKYYSDKYQEDLDEVYTYFGKDNYDSSKVTENRKKCRNR